jgi:hypothetical protein
VVCWTAEGFNLDLPKKALHQQMYDKIAPLEPTSAPTMVSKGLLSINPVAQRAQPEQECNTEMT